MHLQWLINTNATVALIDVNPVGGSYQMLAKASTQEQMIENAAVLVRVLRRAHASRFKKYQEKLERKGRKIIMVSNRKLNRAMLTMAIYS
jgi:hypothetical protein